MDYYYFAKLLRKQRCNLGSQNQRMEIFRFLKNKAGDLLKTKDKPKKQTENKAETKLAILLKIHEGAEKQS